ncbi:MAG: hypothetical protein HC836_33150 [Richelia sp. RM2_1_2]|nr:hypothetical protein [Richelia sp. RM2_1_2]
MGFKNLSDWELTLFNKVRVPSNITIPVDDTCAYLTYPHFRWIFNKLELCRSQGIDCAPVGIMPNKYPVFMKPITNLYGMGIEAKRINHENELVAKPGFFWMEYLYPPHISTDVVFKKGTSVWWGHTIAHKIDDTRFDLWEFCGDTRFESLEKYIREWAKCNISNYTGVFNFETLDEKIIDAHPRMSVQFINLYNDNWLQSVVDLYCHNRWDYNSKEKKGYSMPIWSNDYIDLEMQDAFLCSMLSNVISIHITSETVFQPPTGFRIAVVNGHELESVRQVANIIKESLINPSPQVWRKFILHKSLSSVEVII